MSAWPPIETAPMDGTRVLARRTYWKAGDVLRREKHITWWGKASHVPLYGWCHGRVEDVDLWHPTHWKSRWESKK